jgi:CRISPR-associated protein (TIGR02710 family)
MEQIALEQAWLEYKDLVKQGGNATQLYRERVWPLLLELWRSAPPVYPAVQPYKISIHNLGTSPEATVLAILGTQAEEVYLLHTEESQRYLEWIREQSGKLVYPIQVGKSDVKTIYQQVTQLVRRFPQERVALDVTSGTKAMSAGLAAAGFFLRRFFDGIRVVYVDNEDYDQEVRRPRAGSERLVVLPSPHELLGEIDSFFALEYYRKRDFAQAQAYFAEARRKTQETRFDLYSQLAQAYHGWYSLDFKEASDQLRKLLSNLANEAWVAHPLNHWRPQLQAQQQLLEAADRLVKQEDYREQKGAWALVSTLQRLSEEERRPVLKALYAYRALELLLQERLARLGRSAEAPHLSEQEQGRLREELSRILGVALDQVRLSPKLGLLDLVALLRVLEDPILLKKPLPELQGLKGVLQARNQAMLIHGFEVPSEKEIEGVRKMLKELLSDLGRSLGMSLSLEPIPLEKL